MKYSPLPTDFLEAFQTSEFEWAGGITCKKGGMDGDRLSVELILNSGVEGGSSNWALEILGVKKHWLDFEWADSAEFYEEHILLLDYTEEQCELYINGETSNAEQLVTALYQVWHIHYSDWMGIDKYFDKDLITLSKMKYGLAAFGPRTIMEKYCVSFKKFGRNPHLVGRYKSEIAERPLKLLTIGSNYFIGEMFRFARIG